MPVFQLPLRPTFPPVHLADASGLLAVGGDLTPARLLLAYRRGIFPWYGPGEPILWWAPDPRLVLFPAELHISRRLARVRRQQRFTVTLDQAFERVIAQCAQIPRRDAAGTWIVPAMAAAYTELHRLGYAHSVEAWQSDRLVGGLYGVALGGCFFGESMFSRRSDASKVCLAALADHLAAAGGGLIDCQVRSAHLERLGARTISRAHFTRLLRQALQHPTQRGRWRIGAAGATTRPDGEARPGRPAGPKGR